MGYTKNIAVIKGIKSGFSADGGPLSGVIKAEKYSSELKVEVNLINFAPLTEGRYAVVISDGAHSQIVEAGGFQGSSKVDTSGGFAAVICYVNGGVQLVASAVSGGYSAALLGLKEKLENAETPQKDGNYDDEAIAEANYYEYDQTSESGKPVQKDKDKEEDGRGLHKDEEDSGPVEKPRLAGGNFYEKIKKEAESLLETYPPCEELCRAVENSRWVKIEYVPGKFYVFGIIYYKNEPRYICYGLPAEGDPPDGTQGLSSYLAVPNSKAQGFWIMYQDALTGAAVRADAG